MIQTTYTRKSKTITAPGLRESFPSINAAKRHSRYLQLKAYGALGRGTLRLAGVNDNKKVKF